MKNNRGILFTPIIITIIIMFIFANLVIKLATDEETGVIPNSKRSVAIYNREKAKEDISLAWETVTIDYEGNSDPNKSKAQYFTIENLSSTSYIQGNGIILDFDYGENISRIKYVTYSDNTIYDMIVDNSGVMVIDTTVFDKENSNYIVDKFEIGDYIDIGINYDIEVNDSESNENNKNGEDEEFINTGHLGWKVLKKDGFGITGRLVLISANCPLEYNEETKKMLDECNYIDKTKEIHSVTEDEIMESYKSFKNKKNFEDFWKDIDIPSCLVITLNYGLETDDLETEDIIK